MFLDSRTFRGERLLPVGGFMANFQWQQDVSCQISVPAGLVKGFRFCINECRQALKGCCRKAVNINALAIWVSRKFAGSNVGATRFGEPHFGNSLFDENFGTFIWTMIDAALGAFAKCENEILIDVCAAGKKCHTCNKQLSGWSCLNWCVHFKD